MIVFLGAYGKVCEVVRYSFPVYRPRILSAQHTDANQDNRCYPNECQNKMMTMCRNMLSSPYQFFLFALIPARPPVRAITWSGGRGSTGKPPMNYYNTQPRAIE